MLIDSWNIFKGPILIFPRTVSFLFPCIVKRNKDIKNYHLSVSNTKRFVSSYFHLFHQDGSFVSVARAPDSTRYGRKLKAKLDFFHYDYLRLVKFVSLLCLSLVCQ